MRTRLPIVAVTLAALTLAARAEADAPAGVLLVVGDAAAVAEARGGLERIDARFVAAEVGAPEAPARPEPTADLEALRAMARAGDDGPCLTRAGADHLAIEALLADRLRDAAAAVLVYTAACVEVSGDVARARELLEQAFALELEVGASLREVSVDLQALADRVREAAQSRPRATLTIRTPDPGARVVVDGGAHGCAPTPCEVTLRPGVHHLEIEATGRSTRRLRRVVEGDAAIEVALDPASREEVEAQLATASSDDRARAALLRAAADAFGARLVVVAWVDAGAAHAAGFDRARDGGHLVARNTVRGGATPMRTAVELVAAELDPPSGPSPWPFVAGGVAVAVLVGVGVWLAVRPAPNDLVFDGGR